MRRSLARRSVPALLSLLLAVAPEGAARADPAAAGPEAAPPPGQRSLGFGPTLGFWAGAGAIAGGGGEAVKGWVSVGFAPVLVFSNARTADRATRFNGYAAYQLNGDLTVRLRGLPRGELALLLGYKFNSVIGHGGGAGVRILHDLGRRVALEISAGLAVFPAAEERLERDHGYPDDRTPPITPALQAGANVGLVLFP